MRSANSSRPPAPCSWRCTCCRKHNGIRLSPTIANCIPTFRNTPISLSPGEGSHGQPEESGLILSARIPLRLSGLPENAVEELDKGIALQPKDALAVELRNVFAKQAGMPETPTTPEKLLPRRPRKSRRRPTRRIRHPEGGKWTSEQRKTDESGSRTGSALVSF